MDPPPAPVQLTAAIWYRIVKMLPLHDRFDPALACKRLLEATSPWQAPVFVVVPSSGAAGEEKSSRVTTGNPGSHIQATLGEALSCYDMFRQKEPSRLFEIRLGSGVHETGMKVYGDSVIDRDSPGIISVNDIGGFNLEGSKWKNLLIRSPYGIAYYGETGTLKCIEIYEGVTTIGDRAFYECSSLTSVTLPEGVTTIGDCAFRGCSSLTSVTLPEGVTNRGKWAFPDGCEVIRK